MIFVMKWEWQVLVIRCVKPGYDVLVMWNGEKEFRKQQHKKNHESRSLRKTKQMKTREEMWWRYG